MSTDMFADYARYYDLFYRDKDYRAEAAIVHGLLRAAGCADGTLLDIGCGTGGHVRELATLGWTVTGLDRSAAMIALARERTGANGAIDYAVGAGGDFNLERKFAAIVSLFHVASYHAAPGEFDAMLRHVRAHLPPGGVFIFDFWHGPGVLADPPAVRTRIFEDGATRVTRVSRPRHRAKEHVVEVDYEVTVASPPPVPPPICETHRLRYFFMPELGDALAGAGFRVETTRAGVGTEPLGEHSWYGLVVARALP